MVKCKLKYFTKDEVINSYFTIYQSQCYILSVNDLSVICTPWRWPKHVGVTFTYELVWKQIHLQMNLKISFRTRNKRKRKTRGVVTCCTKLPEQTSLQCGIPDQRYSTSGMCTKSGRQRVIW